MTIYAGIDPGITGGYATISPEGVFAVDLPVIQETQQAAAHLDGVSLAQLVRNTGPDGVVVEAAASYPGQGVRSVFRYGQAYGTILGVLEALQVPVMKVSPGRWKKDLGLEAPPADLSPSKKTAWRKRASLDLASDLFPAHREQWARMKDNHRAEAALLAWWGKRRYVDRMV